MCRRRPRDTVSSPRGVLYSPPVNGAMAAPAAIRRTYLPASSPCQPVTPSKGRGPQHVEKPHA